MVGKGEKRLSFTGINSANQQPDYIIRNGDIMPMETLVCKYCHSEFKTTESQVRRGRGFCRRQCYSNYLSSFVDAEFFSEPNSDMAYVLGLIVSDGCIFRKNIWECICLDQVNR